MHMKKFKSNATETRIDTYEGKEYLVVPVVMAKAGVEMNGGIIQEDQLHAESWNGVPVTIGHPKDNSGNEISANSPKVLEQYSVGQIFNAKVEDGKLKAEAWVNTEKIDANVLSRLQNMDSMDVSTGYFSDIVGNEYKDIKPDHLALLPNEEGACNFNDGCGVRSNGFKEFYTQMKEFFNPNRRSEDNDYRQMKADLISDDRSPFTADDEYALDGMSYETMKLLVSEYLKDKPTTNKGANMIDELISNEASPFTEDDKASLEAMSESAVKALSETYKAPKKEPKVNEVLTNEDREALDLAKQARQEKREEYITHITANSSMCKDKLKEMDTNTLKEIASGIKPAPDYSGRAFGQFDTNAKDEDVIKAMTPQTTFDEIQNRKKEVN